MARARSGCIIFGLCPKALERRLSSVASWLSKEFKIERASRLAIAAMTLLSEKGSGRHGAAPQELFNGEPFSRGKLHLFQ